MDVRNFKLEFWAIQLSCKVNANHNQNWEMELSISSGKKTISIHMPTESQVGFPLSCLPLLSLSSNCFLPLSLSAPNHRNLPKFKSVLSLHCHSAVTSLHPFRHPNRDVDCPLPFIPSRSFHLRKHLILKHHSLHHHHQCLALGGKSLRGTNLIRQSASP